MLFEFNNMIYVRAKINNFLDKANIFQEMTIITSAITGQN